MSCVLPATRWQSEEANGTREVPSQPIQWPHASNHGEHATWTMVPFAPAGSSSHRPLQTTAWIDLSGARVWIPLPNLLLNKGCQRFDVVLADQAGPCIGVQTGESILLGEANLHNRQIALQEGLLIEH